MKKKQTSIILAFVIALAAGCSSTKDNGSAASTSSTPTPMATQAQPTPQPSPVTVTVFQLNAAITDDEFKTFIADPVKQKYPYITTQLVRADKDHQAANLVAAGNLPDLIFTEPVGLDGLKSLNALKDLNALIKSNNYDLNKFEPYITDTLKAYGDKGQIFVLPLAINATALYYNKDLFNKFGVDYPKDGMTWEQAAELAKKLSRTDGGTQYYGLYPGGFDLMRGQSGMPLYDPKTMKSTASTNDAWVKVFQTYKMIMDVPGNNFKGGNIAAFEKDRVIAMMADYGARIGELEQLEKDGNPLNWDMVTYPQLSLNPGKTAEVQIHGLSMSATTKNEDAAFKVLQVVTSDEVQTIVNKNGRLTPLKDAKIKSSFGANLKTLQGKNINAFIKSVPTVTRLVDKYGIIVRGQLSSAMTKVLNGENINTVLLQTQEAADKAIADANK